MAGRESLSLSDLDGENILLYSEIGFWEDIVRSKMPNSRFLVQNERYSLEELVLHSVLPCFASDLTLAIDPAPEGKIPVPLTDPEVNVSYYLLFRKENRKMFLPIWK
ncbi:MAG: hypothetical protein PUC44_07715 [Eubacteriales bacterium]|nr:hypothetical protein [Eubacteriales bacterium]